MPKTASLLAAVVFWGAIGLTGCGGKFEATVKGELTLGGEPVPQGEHVRTSVTFFPAARGAPAYGVVEPDGSYTLQTGTARGLQPGEYRVTVDILEYAPPPPGGYVDAPGFRVLNPPAYRDRKTTPLVVTVETGSNVIDLDVARTATD